MKKAFTIVEVSILFVIFLIVAFLVAPLSLNDKVNEKNISRWKDVQPDFSNIFYSINLKKDEEGFDFQKSFEDIMNAEFKGEIKPYKITYMNGTFPNATYRFNDYRQTIANATVAYKLLDDQNSSLKGLLMYDVNGSMGPNVWGKDVFGFNIYADKFEPFCKNNSVSTQRQDCDSNGTGLCCSNYYLTGGNFD